MKKKGFTLVELLAVIIILAVIALIATPLVLNVVDSAKKSAWESSAYGIMEAVKMNSMDEMLAGESMEAVYQFPSDDIEIQGMQPTGGQASVNKEGKVAIAIHNGKWCALKDYDDEKVTLVDYDGECTLGMEIPDDDIVSGDEPIDTTPIIQEEPEVECTGGECGFDEIVVVPSEEDPDGDDDIGGSTGGSSDGSSSSGKRTVYFTIYTVGYITNTTIEDKTYSINITDLPIDLSQYDLELVSSGVMTTQTDFNNYVNMKASGKPATSLVGSTTNTGSSTATAQELYQYSLGTNELILNSVTINCGATSCTATMDESFQNLEGKTFHQTKTVGGADLSALYNGVKFKVKAVEKSGFTSYYSVAEESSDGFEFNASGSITNYYGKETEITIPSELTLTQPTYYELNEKECIDWYMDLDVSESDALYACKLVLYMMPESAAKLGLVTLKEGYLKLTNLKFNEDGCIKYMMWNEETEEYAKSYCKEPSTKEEMESFSKEDAVAAFGFHSIGVLDGQKEVINHEGTLDVSISTISPYAFESNDLTSVTISNNIKNIGQRAFYDNSLTSINIPTSVIYIGGGAFTKNNFSESYAYIYGRNNDGTINESNLVSYAGTATSVTIASNVKAIEDYAFYNLGLTSVVLSEKTEKIGMYSLASNALTTITLPSSVTEIGESALEKSSTSNKGLTSIINKTGKAFDWSRITSSSTKGQSFIIGTVTHADGDITVTDK